MSKLRNTVLTAVDVAGVGLSIAAAAYYSPGTLLALTAYKVAEKVTQNIPYISPVQQAVRLGMNYIANAQLQKGLTQHFPYETIIAPTLTVIASNFISKAFDHVTGDREDHFSVKETIRDSASIIGTNLAIRYIASEAHPLAAKIIPHDIKILHIKQNIGKIAVSATAGLSIAAIVDLSGLKNNISKAATIAANAATTIRNALSRASAKRTPIIPPPATKRKKPKKKSGAAR